MQTIFDVLRKQISNQIETAKDHLSAGTVSDYAEYREVRGIIRGLQSAELTVSELERANMRNDDD